MREDRPIPRPQHPPTRRQPGLLRQIFNDPQPVLDELRAEHGPGLARLERNLLSCRHVARRFGGCPTYALTDNEMTVTVEHVARVAIRNPDMVAAANHYGLTVAT